MDKLRHCPECGRPLTLTEWGDYGWCYNCQPHKCYALFGKKEYVNPINWEPLTAYEVPLPKVENV
jgi:hypothetical protein